MGNKIKFKRGSRSKLPERLAYGEPAFVSDEEELYIGTQSGNVKLTHKSEIEKIASHMQQIASSFVSVTSLGCTTNEIDAANNTNFIQNAINKGIDLNFNILVPINNTIKIPKSYSNHKINFENRFTTGLLMISDNMPILETEEYDTKNIVINNLGLQYKNPQRVNCEKSKALFFNLKTDISRGFYGWYINGIYIKNCYTGITKSDVNRAVIWGCYFKDIQIEDVYGKAISLIAVNAGQLDNIIEGLKIYNYNIVDLGQGDIRNDGNSAIEVSGEIKIDFIDIENWHLSNNKPLIKIDRVHGGIKNIHLERIHFRNSECIIFDTINSQFDVDVFNMSNSYYYDNCNELNIFRLKSDIFANSNCKLNFKNVVIKDKQQNSNTIKKYIIKQYNSIPCFANINNFVQYQSDNNWIINNPSQVNEIFKNVVFENNKIELAALPTISTWNKGEMFLVNNREIFVENGGTIKNINKHTCSTISGSNVVTIPNMQSYAFFVDEYVTIENTKFKIMARNNNQIILDKPVSDTLNNVSISYTPPEYTQFKRIDEQIKKQGHNGFLKYMREGNYVQIKGEIILSSPQTVNHFKLFELPENIKSNESTFDTGETIVINLCTDHGGAVGLVPVLIKNNSVLVHCINRGTLSDVSKINLNICYMISQV